MKILRWIIGVIVMPVMIVASLVAIFLVIFSVELQPENLTNLTTDIIADTLSKDNLKKIQVADVAEYLPEDIKASLPAEATMEEVVPIAFNNLTGIESYISLESVEQMINDDVVKDFTMAVINEEKYDLIGLADKYEVQLEPHEKELLAEVDTSTFKGELAKQGYDIDKMTSEGLGALEGGGTDSGSQNGQSPLAQYLALLQPGVTIAILIATLAIFYLIFGLIWWNLRIGLIWWGVGVGLVGIILLVLNGVKFELVNFGLSFANIKLNTALIAPAVERLVRPVIISGVVCLVSGAGAVVGGKFWQKKHRAKSADLKA